MKTYIKAAIQTLNISLARIAELAIDLSINLILKHPWALMSLRRFLIPLKLLYFSRLILNYLLQIVYAVMVALISSDYNLTAFVALYLHFRTLVCKMDFDLFLCHFLGVPVWSAFLRARVYFIPWTVKFQMIDQFSITVLFTFDFLLDFLMGICLFILAYSLCLGWNLNLLRTIYLFSFNLILLITGLRSSDF